MDHLSFPSGATSDAFNVPYLARPEYTFNGTGFKDFRDFPLIHNFVIKSIKSHSPEDILAFHQSWLYFGLLAEIMQGPIDHSKFIRQDARSGEKILSSLALADLKPVVRTRTGSGYMFIARYEDVKRIKAVLDWTLDEVIYLDKHIGSEYPGLPMILLSIRVLVDSLMVTAIRYKAKELMPMSLRLRQDSATLGLLTQMMVDNGWCVFQINQVFNSFHPSLVCYISQIKRYQRKGISHERCTKQACIAFNIDTKTYKSRHVRDECQCEFLSVPEDDLNKILDRGDIPLVWVERNRSGGFVLKIKSREAQDRYIAFSHVWSDGLGNVSGNAISACQAERLHGYIQKCERVTQGLQSGALLEIDMMRLSTDYRTKYFWLDTLCIPPTRDNADKLYKERKRKAINNIAPVFATSARIIVLDAEFSENVHFKTMNWTELAVRTLFSTWAGRCWTLEEGAVSRACQIQCVDGSFDPNAALDDGSSFSMNPQNMPSYGRMLVRGMGALKKYLLATLSGYLNPKEAQDQKRTSEFSYRLGKLMSGPLRRDLKEAFMEEWRMENVWRDDSEVLPKESIRHFVNCWNALGVRQTSRGEDRIMILATLLDLNAYQIMASEIPLMALLRSMPGIPISLLYDPRPLSPAAQLRAHQTKELAFLDSSSSTDSAAIPSTEYNRWLPIYPSNHRLNLPRIRYESRQGPYGLYWTDNFLEFEQNRYVGLKAYLIEIPQSTTADAFEFVVQSRTNPDRSRDYYYRVEFLRDFTHLGEQFLPNVFNSKTCLLLDRDEQWDGSRDGFEITIMMRGACLQVNRVEVEKLAPKEKESVGSKSEEETFITKIEAVYDCPLLISMSLKTTGAVPNEETLPICASLSDWKVKMRHNCGAAQPVPIRLGALQYGAFSFGMAMATAGPFFLCEVLSTTIFYYITGRAFFGKAPTTAKVGLATYWIGRYGSFPFGLGDHTPAVYLVTTLFYGYMKSRAGPLSRLDRFVVILSVVGQIGQMIGISFCRRFVMPGIFNDYLASYRPIEKDKGDLKWTRRTGKAMKFFKKITDWLDSD